MANPYDYPQNKLQGGNINFSGTLSTVSSSQALTEGMWLLWADQDFYYEVKASTGWDLVANPRAILARYPEEVPVGSGGLTLRLRAISTSGNWYINKDFHLRGG